MASLEDLILNGKPAGYCSSSEDEEDDKAASAAGPRPGPAPPGSARNTGPKGVLEDWRRYKQLQAERQVEQNQEMLALAKRLSMTCRTHADDERAKVEERDAELLKELEEEDGDDAFLKEYMQRRLLQMRATLHAQNTSTANGQVIELSTADDFLRAIDDSALSTVVVHIFEPNVAGCDAMDGCLRTLAQSYRHVKFCRVRASSLGTTAKFSKNGVPTLQAYRDGQLIGNFVRLSDEFGHDFFADEVESYLKEYGILSDDVTAENKSTAAPRQLEPDDSGSD